MKRILYFLGLKVLEIGGAVLLVLGLRRLAEFVYGIFGSGQSMGVLDYIACGLVIPLMTLVIPIMVIGLIWQCISWNWQKAGELAGKYEDSHLLK